MSKTLVINGIQWMRINKTYYQTVKYSAWHFKIYRQAKLREANYWERAVVLSLRRDLSKHAGSSYQENFRDILIEPHLWIGLCSSRHSNMIKQKHLNVRNDITL